MSIFKRNVEGRNVDQEIAIAVEKARSDLRHDFDLRIQRMESEQEIALKEKDFELKHFESEKVKNLEARVVDLEKELAVEKKTNEMLNKLTDLNADVIDVKSLVTNLINKLPEVKINSLAVTSHGNNSKE